MGLATGEKVLGESVLNLCIGAYPVIGDLASNDSDGLLVDIRNVSNRGVRFNPSLEPILSFDIVPKAVTQGSEAVSTWVSGTILWIRGLTAP